MYGETGLNQILNLHNPSYGWKEKDMKIKVKCVNCDFKKEVDKEQINMPLCDKCYSPMIAYEVLAKLKEA